MKKDKRRISLDLRDPVQARLLEECVKARDAFRDEAALLDAPQIAIVQAGETLKHQEIQRQVNERHAQLEEVRRLQVPLDNNLGIYGMGALETAMVRRPRRPRRRVIEQAIGQGVEAPSQLPPPITIEEIARRYPIQTTEREYVRFPIRIGQAQQANQPDLGRANTDE